MKLEAMLAVRYLIYQLRGGVPDKCDFCGEKYFHWELDPEEGGLWVCHQCQQRWEEDDAANKKDQP